MLKLRLGLEAAKILMLKLLILTLSLFMTMACATAFAQGETYLSQQGTDPETTRGESRLLHYRDEDFPVEVHIPSPSWIGAQDRVRQVRRAFEAWADAAPEIVSFTFVEEPNPNTLTVDWETLDVNLAGSYRYSFGVLDNGQYDYQATRIILDPATEPDALYRYALLQVGHALGLFGRSPVEGDALSAVPSGEITERDIATLRALYALPSGTVLRD